MVCDKMSKTHTDILTFICILCATAAGFLMSSKFTQKQVHTHVNIYTYLLTMPCDLSNLLKTMAKAL